MKETVYITGHRNPDSDSICAAIGYADLKNRRGFENAIPLRLGEINNETKFILDYFGVEEPLYKETMKPQVSDIDFDQPYKVSKDIPMNKALNIIQNSRVSSVQVVDEQDKLLGIVSLSNLTKGYMDIWDDNILGRSNTSLDNIVEVLSAQIINEPKNPRPFIGRMAVYAMEPEDIKDNILKNDVVIVGNRENAQRDAIEKGVSLLILTIGSELSSENLELAKKNDVTVLSTELDTFLTARLLPLSVPVEYIMSKSDLIKFKPDDFVDDIKIIMGNTRFRSYPIVDHQDRVLGSISRYHLISSKKKHLILVDHNEKNQSIQDIESAEIREIVDHHRVANISTSNPIFFRNEPVGSTSTIIAMMFFEQGVSPSKEIAGILSGAIISDTLLLRSPTATEIDKRMLSRMSKIANIDVEKFATEMFKAGTSLENKQPQDLLKEDVKQFVIEGEKVRVAQVLTMDLESLHNRKDELLKHMKDIMDMNGESTFILVFTDILQEISEMLVVGEYKEQIANGFGAVLVDNSFSAPGVLSRKKQVIPSITQSIFEAKN